MSAYILWTDWYTWKLYFLDETIHTICSHKLNILIVGHISHRPPESRNLPAMSLWRGENIVRKKKECNVWTAEESPCTRKNIPVSIRRVEIRRYIGPPGPVAHIRIGTSWTVLLHPRNISPFRQNLNITLNTQNLAEICYWSNHKAFIIRSQGLFLVTKD